MRRPLAFSALALVVGALTAAQATPQKDPPPELVQTACSSGLLVQPAEDPGPATDAAPDADASANDSADDPGLFGGSDDGDKKEKKAKPKKKPKTKLLRPRTDKDKADCPGKFSAFYRQNGGKFNAVPAPSNLSAEQIEGNIDRAYAASFGPAKGQLMTDIKGEDISKKWDVVNRIFDGIGPKQPLDDAAFGVTVAKNLHTLVNDKVILPSDLGGRTPEELAAAPKAEPAAAPRPPLDPKAPNDPRSPAQLAAERPVKSPPAPNAIVPPAAPMVIPPDVVPTEPGRVRQFYNNFKAEVGDYMRGSPIANYEGERTILPNPTPIMSPGGDQRINVRLPASTGITPRCEPGCYGTQKMIALLVGMGEEFSAYYQGKRTMSVGGISKPGGGYFPPHVSHQKGIDADVTFQSGPGGFDVAANAMIVAAVIRKLPDFHHINGQEYILCDQSKHAAIGYGLDQLVKQGNLTPEQAARGKSVLVHWPNHNDHFHIRILP